VGAWTNEDPGTRGVTRVTVVNRNNKLVLHAWGSCYPQECDWGDAEGFVQDGRVLVKWNPGFLITQWQVVLETPLRLRISGHDHFTDASGRPDMDYNSFFGRSCESRDGTDGLPSPALLMPSDGSKFDNPGPRRTTLEWGAVPGAASYTVEVDCFHCCQTGHWCTDVGTTWLIAPNVANLAYQHNFVGAQPGRWRVCAIDASGHAGARSAWSGFLYLR
jgi:hypothetical protein